MPTGTGKTYNFTAGTKLDVEDLVYTLTPTDVPLLGTYNGTDVHPSAENAILPKGTADQIKVEWIEEDLLTPRTTLAATAVTADTFIVVASGDTLRFSTGDTIRIDAEVLRITGYGSTTDSLTVTRAFAATTAAQHSNAAVVIGVGTALPEGSDPEASRFKDRSKLFNMTEIFGPWAVKVSGTREAIVQYGVTSEFDKQVANRTRELFVGIEQAIIYGVRLDDTSNFWRQMGGLLYYITTNVDSTTTDITQESALLTQLQASYDVGGLVDTLVMGSTQKRKVSSYSSSAVRFTRSERIRGQVVDVYESDFGVCDMVLDRFVRKADLIGIEKQFISVETLRPAMVEMLAKTGDSINAQILCEKTLKVRNEKRHMRFSALT